MRILVVASDRAELAAFDDSFIKVVSGVGPVFAAASTASAIGQYKPDIVVSAGSAGSTGMLEIGECVSFGFSVFADMDLTAYHLRRGTSLTPERCTISSINLDGSSSLVLATSASFASDPEKYREFNAAAVDMEGYGVAYASLLAGLPCLAVKVITDMIGEKPELKGYSGTLRNLRAKLPEKVLEAVSAL